jgi:WD40 repeat protein
MKFPEPEQIPERIVVDNERSLRKLARSITNSQGNFVLIIARCNYRSLQNEMVQRLKQQCPMEIQELHLSKSVKTLFTTIQGDLEDRQPPALMIFGLELVEALDQVLISTNQVREEFRKNFPFPIVLWVNDEIFQKLIRRMPDFKNWTGNSIKFELGINELITNLQETISLVFSAILNAVSGIFLDNASLNLDFDAYDFLEMELAVKDLQKSMQPLAPELTASIQFLLGREADASNNKSEARTYYEQSLSFWQQRVTDEENRLLDDIKRYGCVLLHLGLWWRQYANLHRSEHRQACEQAKEYFQKCVDIFEQSNQPNLAAKYINLWGEVLTQLAAWEELEKVATQAINLHKAHPEPVKLGYSYGLMAEVALQKSDWMQTKEYAELALQTNDIIIQRQNNIPANKTEIWDWERKNFRNFYLLLLAQAQQHLQQVSEAISHLETARFHCNPQLDPLLYIRILSTLQKLYFDESKYLEAFEIKQELRSIEQQYGLRAFVGAGRLQSRRQVANLGLGIRDRKADVSPEIAASGRLQDVNRLIERIGRPDCKLTVVYGQSGVGKSSLVQAGLLPALKQQSVEARDVVPVLLQVYTDWIKTLGSHFVESIEEVKGLSFPHFLDTMAAFTAELKKNIDNNSLTVLIFDQFEEFFFAYKDPVQRQPFFEFIRDCLNIPYVKIILSLREDYLHYLLECDRLVRLEAIDRNILDKKILYYLGNFSPEDARSVIVNLTESSQFHLDVELIDELVRDLASNFNEVRPIELQVVGAQLQTEQITTLAQYQESGPKEELVGRFLEEVVKDCGENNEQFAKLVLYILTDENNTRPLKNRAEIEAELALETERLDLILKILVKSGLVFQVPGFPSDRYQLVHDYLVPFVRQQQSERLIKELEKEREQRKLTEAKLNQVLRQQLQAVRRAYYTLFGLVIALGGFGAIATTAGINLYLNRPIAASEQNSQLEDLVANIKQAKALKKLSLGAIPGTHLNVMASLNSAISTSNEVNHLRGHDGAITSISFSADDKLLATVSKDKTVKIWDMNGKNIQTLKGHKDTIRSVSFSRDSKLIATASKDRTVKIWNLNNGKVIQELPEPTQNATSVSFSPDGKVLAVSNDKQVILWNLASAKTRTLSGHKGTITNVSFSPNGKIIASADNDDAIFIWKLEDGGKIRSIDNYGAIDMRFSPNGKNLVLTNKDKTIKIYELNTGVLLRNFSHNNEMEIANLSLDNKHLAFVALNRSSAIFICNPSKDDCDNDNIRKLGFHNDNVTNLSFSHNGKFLASGSKDKTVKLWSIDSKAFQVSEDKDRTVWQVKVSPNNKIIAANSQEYVHLFNQNGTLIGTFDGYIKNLNFSSNGKIFTTGTANSAVQISSLNGKDIFLGGKKDNISSLALSLDSQTVATAEDKTVKLWSSANSSLIKAFTSHKKKVTKLIFSNDSKTVASIGDDNKVNLYNSDGSFIKTLSGHTNSVSNVTFSHDSQLIATDGDDNLVKLWKRDGTFLKALTGHISVVKKVIFSNNDQIIASVGSNDGVKLWKHDGNLLSTIDYPGIQDIKFSPDSDIIASIHEDKTVKLWSIDGKLLTTFRKHHDTIKSVSFSPIDKTIISAGDDAKIQLWRTDGTLLKTLPGNINKIKTVKFSPDGLFIISVAYDNTVKLWSRNGEFIKTLYPGNTEVLDYKTFDNDNSISISPDSKIITYLISTFSFFQGRNQFIVKMWNSEGKELKEIQKNSFIGLNFTGLSGDSKTIAFFIPEYDLQLRSIDNSKLFATLRDSDSVNGTLSFSPDSQTIATTNKDNTIQLWHTDIRGKFKKPYQIIKGHSDTINSVSFSPDGKIIASASNDKTVKLWNRDGTRFKTLSHQGKVNSVAFSSSDGILASAAEDATVKLWDRQGREQRKLQHNQPVKYVAFSPDGNTILTQSNDYIKLWNRNGQEIKSIDGSQNSSFNFSPDSKIAVATSYSELKLHYLNGVWFKEASIEGFSNLNDLSFSPDGKTIVVTSDDGISILSLDIDELLKRACNLAQDYLQNNPKMESDRNLCQGIATPKSN